METYFRHIGYHPENASSNTILDAEKTQRAFEGYKKSMDDTKKRMQTAQLYRDQMKQQTPRPVFYRCEHCGV